MPFETLAVPVVIDEDGFYWTTAPMVCRGRTDTIVVEPCSRTDLFRRSLRELGVRPYRAQQDEVHGQAAARRRP
jgi:hypothetical protein